MDTLSRIPGLSSLRQQLSGGHYSSLPREGGDGDVVFQAEEDGDVEHGEEHALAERAARNHVLEDGELGEEVSDEHAAFVHEHASYRGRRKRRGGAVTVKLSTFVKALAALFALWGLWVAMKVGWTWFVAPKKSASLDMPAFGTQLGCEDAPYFYINPEFESTATNHTVFTLPLNTPEGANTFLLRTQGSNTSLTVTLEHQADALETDLILEAAISSPEPNMDFRVSGAGPQFDAAPHIIFEALEGAPYCLRVDVILRLPGNLNALTLDLQTVAQVRIGDSWGNGRDAFAPFLHTLDVTLHADSPANLLLPSPGFTAETTKLSLAAGYIAGEVALAQSLEISATPRGNVDLLTTVLQSQAGMGATTAALETHSGEGAFHMRVQSPGHERCLQAQHQSSGDMQLEYEDFVGEASYSAGGGLDVEGVGAGGQVGGGGCDTLRVNCGGKLDLSM
ncbi:hypothetical protein CALVIDRAFT_596297 [Calocera viscosa TUFC12733]|uniref:Uncharacterized protein n=1 Tax=Calocera viscosa (strain TUFC12733) TaxID=1330018 RepID=A0A167PWR2_CALVF|nr:hypothetical protein CALVIDRAFT_596297 [Calocera viscosa TUFC12733]